MDGEVMPFESLLDVSQSMADGTTSSINLTRMMIERIERKSNSLHGYALVLSESAIAEAEKADQEIAQGLHRGPLHGVPIAVKDLLTTAGQVTACGTTMLADWKPEADSTIVARLRSAGAVIIGKAQMTEGATGAHHPTIAPPVNPWNADYCSGFSSSGSGVIAAAGLAYAAIGSDTGGSIRIPSAMNGVTGLKPTWGRVSRNGVFPLVEYLDTLGPMARSAADCAAVMAAIAGADANDPTAQSVPVPNYLMTIERGVSGKVIGYDRKLIENCCDPEVTATVDSAAEIFASLGAEIVPVSFPQFDMTGIMAMMMAGIADAHRDTYPARASEYGPDIIRMIEGGRAVPAMDVAAGINAANAFRARLHALFNRIDLLLMPALTIVTPGVGVLERAITGSPQGMAPMRFTVPFNVSGSPTITLPGGFDNRGLPIGFQLVGRHFDEAALFEAGHAYQRRTDWHLRRPPLG